jgi:membrane protein DedA with SNARE-associated domain
MYATIFFFAFIENIFPPSPSDLIVIFGGALTAMEHGNLFIALGAAAIGSTAGFVVMYWIGKWFGLRVLETGKIRFIHIDVVHRLERWFKKYGFWLIVANRFLSGTRAVISFFAGMSRLEFSTTLILSFISSAAWYGILVYAGYSLGEHWAQLEFYLRTYSEIVTGLILVAIIIVFIRYRIRKSGATTNP